MGLPVAQFVIGSNRNDILSRLLASGRMEAAAVEPSLSPSMDIQVSSNFERLLFELCGRKGETVARLMREFRARGTMTLSSTRWARLKAQFAGAGVSDEATVATIREVWQGSGELIDPHTAVGVAAARRASRDTAVPTIALACAHPAKFPDAVERATGQRPALPARLADLYQRPERVAVMPNDLRAVQDFIRSRVKVLA